MNTQNKTNNNDKTISVLQKLFNSIKLHYNNGVDKEDNELYLMLSDVHCNGADAGYYGFSYLKDTNEFYDKNRELIVKHLIYSCDEVSESIIQFVKNWNCMKGMIENASDEYAMMCVLCGVETDHEDAAIYKNNLCWFALEEVAWAIETGLIKQ